MECGSVAEAERVLSVGLLCFYIRISPNQIQREDYTNLLMCFNCYYENHITSNCPHKKVSTGVLNVEQKTTISMNVHPIIENSA